MTSSSAESSGKSRAWGFGGFTASSDFDGLVMRMPDSPTTRSSISSAGKSEGHCTPAGTSSALRSPQMTRALFPPPLVTAGSSPSLPTTTFALHEDNDSNAMDNMDIGLMLFRKSSSRPSRLRKSTSDLSWDRSSPASAAPTSTRRVSRRIKSPSDLSWDGSVDSNAQDW